MLKVSIIIVSYNSLPEINACLDALYAQDFKDWELIAIDNASSDGSADLLKKQEAQRQYRLILNQENLGFCKANNQAINASSGEYILFLNPDSALIGRDVLGKFVDAMDGEESLASVTGKLFKDPAKKIIDSTGITFKKYSYIPFDRGEGEIDRGQYDKDEYIFGPSCACAFYRRRALEDVKYNGQYFDEDFFAYFEDVDLAWRAGSRGWKSKYIGCCTGYHNRKGDRSKDYRTQMRAFRNAYLAVVKNMKGSAFMSPAKLAYNLLAVFKKIILRPYLLLAFVNVLVLIPRMLKKKYAMSAGGGE